MLAFFGIDFVRVSITSKRLGLLAEELQLFLHRWSYAHSKRRCRQYFYFRRRDWHRIVNRLPQLNDPAVLRHAASL